MLEGFVKKLNTSMWNFTQFLEKFEENNKER